MRRTTPIAHRSALRVLLACLAIATTLSAGCAADDEAPGATVTSAAASATAAPRTPTPTAQAAGPAAPSSVEIEGALPDLRTPVPEGQGELGRYTVSWQDNSGDEDGFRIYQDCDGEAAQLAAVAANETSLGPLQSCRPGRVGVAAFNGEGESAIAWSP